MRLRRTAAEVEQGSEAAVPTHRGTLTTADGAVLYYETRGSGSAVLIIQGGLGEAGTTEQLADALSEHHQVISYDRRGLSRSTVAAESPPSTMATHADDAATLLAATAQQPAHVVGASIGALIGLHLAWRHPERVATLVAHEPPMTAVVNDPEREAALDEVAALADGDVVAAIQHMATLTSSGQTSAEEGARPAPPVGDLEANLRRFFDSEFPAVRHSTLNTEHITSIPTSTRVIPTGGLESRGQWEHRCAEQLAKVLGRELVEMPGGHNGLTSHPWATAAELRLLFTEAAHET